MRAISKLGSGARRCLNLVMHYVSVASNWSIETKVTSQTFRRNCAEPCHARDSIAPTANGPLCSPRFHRDARKSHRRGGLGTKASGMKQAGFLHDAKWGVDRVVRDVSRKTHACAGHLARRNEITAATTRRRPLLPGSNVLFSTTCNSVPDRKSTFTLRFQIQSTLDVVHRQVKRHCAVDRHH